MTKFPLHERAFGGIPEQYASYQHAGILLQAFPYDGTSTWGKGADAGFDAFLNAAENMELYDIETDSEVYRKGICTLQPLVDDTSPEHNYRLTYETAKSLLQEDKFLTFFGGEHSVSIGIIEAFAETYPGLNVLQIDAHADLRPTYEGSPYNHACALYQASRTTNLIQVGIRSMDASEKEYLRPGHCFFAHEIHAARDWVDQVLDLLSDPVYITVDLDALDPSIMPATGTPEPGGLDWYSITQLLRAVFNSRQVVGFDIVELAPVTGNPAPDFLVAKLYYKMLSYKFQKS